MTGGGRHGHIDKSALIISNLINPIPNHSPNRSPPQAAASDVVLLNFGRLVVGTASGLLCSPVGVYVAEVTTPAYRTSFGSVIRDGRTQHHFTLLSKRCLHFAFNRRELQFCL